MKEIISNTPYDDVYRTMIVEDDELVLPLLNEVFGDNYSGKEKIVRYANEHYNIQQDGAEEKRITDSFLEVIGKQRKRYHCECESTPDGSILVRMFSYGSQLALVDSRFDGKKLKVSFPEAAVLFLRSNSRTPDKMEIEISTPGGRVSYDVKTLKISGYSLEEIFDKRLYFLLPFYLFNLETKLEEYNSNPVKQEELIDIYNKINKKLEDLVLEGKLSEYSRLLILILSNKVAQNLAERYDQVRKDIGDIMGGQVLDLEIIRIKHRIDEAQQKLEKEKARTSKAKKRAAKEKERAAREKERADKAESRVKELEEMIVKLEQE